jgi:hypothetical protein
MTSTVRAVARRNFMANGAQSTRSGGGPGPLRSG